MRKTGIPDTKQEATADPRYFIALVQGYDLFKQSNALFDKVTKENYIFVFHRPVDDELTGCFVYDSPRFILRDEAGSTYLTHYAMEHLKECCLELPKYRMAYM